MAIERLQQDLLTGMKIPASFILTSRNVNWHIGSWVCPNVSTYFRFGGKCFILNVFKSFCKCSSLLCIQSSSFINRKTLCKINVFNKYILHKVFSKHRPSGSMLSISRNVRLSVRLSVCLSVCLCVCLFTFEVPFNGLFAPTSRSCMSNIFRDSESLGKSNGKKWSNI